MLIDRIAFTLHLVADTALAVGSGALEKKDGGEDGSIADIHRGVGNRPCIPATTIKGALRERWPRDKKAEADRLFGDIGHGETGTAGTLLLYAASLDDDLSTPKPPVKSPVKSPLGKNEFDRPATAIDRDTGAAEHNKLFARRSVAEGAVFVLDGCLQCRLDGPDAAAATTQTTAALAQLAQALAPLSDGIAVGRGTRQGYGRLRLQRVARVEVKRFGPSGYGTATEETIRADARVLAERIRDAATSAENNRRPGPVPSLRLTLHAPGPFLILDPSAAPSVSASVDGVETHVNVRGLEAPGGGTPVLWPSSFLGALRSRAAWILEIDRLRRKDDCIYVPRERGDKAADDRFLEDVFTDRRAVLHPGDLRMLSSVERLFGVPGWRGLISIAGLRCTDRGCKRSRTSLAIDRLTGGGKDGALFTVEAAEGCTFAIDLAIDWPRLDAVDTHGVLRTKDEAFVGDLKRDLITNGLMLGHGAARGYGWFTVTDNAEG